MRRYGEENIKYQGNHKDKFQDRICKRKISGTLPTNEREMISLPYQEWNWLDDKVEPYVQEYNVKIKHGKSTSNLTAPRGIEIESKHRRIMQDQNEKREEDPQQRGKILEDRDSHPRKQIQFQLIKEHGSNDL